MFIQAECVLCSKFKVYIRTLRLKSFKNIVVQPGRWHKHVDKVHASQQLIPPLSQHYYYSACVCVCVQGTSRRSRKCWSGWSSSVMRTPSRTLTGRCCTHSLTPKTTLLSTSVSLSTLTNDFPWIWQKFWLNHHEIFELFVYFQKQVTCSFADNLSCSIHS